MTTVSISMVSGGSDVAAEEIEFAISLQRLFALGHGRCPRGVCLRGKCTSRKAVIARS